MIDLPATGEDERRLWNELFDLANESKDWTLIGARMVELHAARSGRSLPRVSRDGDALADARARPNAVRALARILTSKGFRMKDPNAMGIGHAFVRDGVEIDVLAPDGLGDRERSEKARITVAPARTVEVPGGTQALRRTQRVEVRVGGRAGMIPLPNLVGAILLKARAVEVDDRPEDQRGDLALLLSLVPDPRLHAGELTATERGWLRARSEMNAPNASCWRGLSDAEAQLGLGALRQLSARP